MNSKGDVDVNFHDEDESGQSHTLVIKSHFGDIDESVKYVFREGHCLVRSVPVPSERGEFTFVVAHSRYPDLQLTLKVKFFSLKIILLIILLQSALCVGLKLNLIRII